MHISVLLYFSDCVLHSYSEFKNRLNYCQKK